MAKGKLLRFPRVDLEAVVTFAGYCVGSEKGDRHPDVEAEERKVRTEKKAYEIWRGRMLKYNAEMREQGYAEISSARIGTD